ncbi:folylpolyglutamate synthase [Mycoblastus sanguinarius]|nr:folylpolyglutamate synthase [Mycoblastus sanguinarius]
MIELGLARISRLLRDCQMSWRAIHVAGTNGKGSVCAYASAMLSAGKVKCGRFTSPHLIDKWDCITINDNTVAEDLFYEVEAKLKAKDQNEGIKASEFEILTATAFEIFNREKVEIGVVEVGLGGTHDATNLLDNPLVTVITKIGIDHQSFLGDTLEEIAHHKAGIMKMGALCVVDGSNLPKVINVLRKNAKDSKAASFVLVPQDTEAYDQVWNILQKGNFEDHQQMNISLAFEAVKHVFSSTSLSIEPHQFLPAILRAKWPGRLQHLSIESMTGRKDDVLLDGAHNAQSAEVLGSYVDRRLRTGVQPVTWVLAVSKGKPLQELLSHILRPGDNIVAVRFGQVDGMPWVRSAGTQEIIDAARNLDMADRCRWVSGHLGDALQLATELSNEGPLVIAGSLYLISDVLRYLRQVE